MTDEVLYELDGQDHVLAGWDRLDPEQRAALVGQLQALDLDELHRLYGHLHCGVYVQVTAAGAVKTGDLAVLG